MQVDRDECMYDAHGVILDMRTADGGVLPSFQRVMRRHSFPHLTVEDVQQVYDEIKATMKDAT